MSAFFVEMLSHLKGNPGNGYRPGAGTACLMSGPNCDNENGYTYTEVEILWRDEVFVVYRKTGCWPVVNKWDHVFAKPKDQAETRIGAAV